mgnify:CR=1 FL=1
MRLCRREASTRDRAGGVPARPVGLSRETARRYDLGRSFHIVSARPLAPPAGLRDHPGPRTAPPAAVRLSYAAAVDVGRLGIPIYWTGRAVFGAAARVYFRSIDVRHRDRVPRHGPVLVVSNHPASFTDVIVLGLAVPRRLHFLAMAPIFRPWIRGLALRLCGTLPIYRRQDDPGLTERNDDTFRACHQFLDGGGAVLIFPEE